MQRWDQAKNRVTLGKRIINSIEGKTIWLEVSGGPTKTWKKKSGAMKTKAAMILGLIIHLCFLVLTGAFLLRFNTFEPYLTASWKLLCRQWELLWPHDHPPVWKWQPSCFCEVSYMLLPYLMSFSMNRPCDGSKQPSYSSSLLYFKNLLKFERQIKHTPFWVAWLCSLNFGKLHHKHTPFY